MRIQKGCIGISDVKDVPLLRQVLHSQLITHEQLWSFMYLQLYELNRPSFNWRVRRLVESGLLARHSKLPYTESYVYSMTNAGAEVLINRGEWFPMLSGDNGRKQRLSVAHTLRLNDLQLSLVREGILESWKPEPMIRFENDCLANPHAKDYDAIVTVRIDHRKPRWPPQNRPCVATEVGSQCSISSMKGQPSGTETIAISGSWSSRRQH